MNGLDKLGGSGVINDNANGYVIADAVRWTKESAPPVTSTNTPIPSDTPTASNTPLPSYTPTVSNTPTITNTPLPPSVTPTASNTPLASDTPTVSPTSEGGVLVNHIVDDSDTGFTPIGSWITYTNAQANYDFYSGSGRAKQAGNGGSTGTFQPDLPEAGDYEIFVWLDRRSDGTTNLPFMINHGGGPTIVTVNLRTEPPANGGWVSLGTYPFPSGTGGTVVVSDDASSGYVIADAVRWYKPGAPTAVPTATDTPIAPEVVILDNAAASGVTVVGGWATYANNQIPGGYTFYNGSGLVKGAGNGSATVTYQPTIPKTATYEVFIWLDAFSRGASNMLVQINHAGGTTNKTVNIKTAPSTGGWVSLGTYTFNIGTTGSVVVFDQANGYVFADAIRWMEVP